MHLPITSMGMRCLMVTRSLTLVGQSQEAKNQQQMTPKVANKAFSVKSTQIIHLERHKEPYSIAIWTCNDVCSSQLGNRQTHTHTEQLMVTLRCMHHDFTYKYNVVCCTLYMVCTQLQKIVDAGHATVASFQLYRYVHVCLGAMPHAFLWYPLTIWLAKIVRSAWTHEVSNLECWI